MLGTFSTHDTSLQIQWDDSVIGPQGNFGLTSTQWELWGRACHLLAGLGFNITVDPNTLKNHRIIAKYYRRGKHPSGLEVKTDCHRAVCRFEFFQNINRENPNGGEYDYGKLARMPYLVRLRCQVVRRKLCRVLEELGLTFDGDRARVDPAVDPLGWFNGTWGAGRFARRADGWPDPAKEMSHGNKDRDGLPLDVGVERYYRCRHTGRLYRGRCYPNMNSMWGVVSGATFTCVSSSELFSCADPRQQPRRLMPNRRRRLESEKKKAIEAENYERAAVLRDILRREPPA